jgi:hypothetical protein
LSVRLSGEASRERSFKEAAAWLAALVLAAFALAAFGYQTRDPDSRLYAQIAARMAGEPLAGWIPRPRPPISPTRSTRC